MRKLFCLCICVCIAGLAKAQVNLSVAGLSKEKAYTLQTARGGWYADSKFKSTNDAKATVSNTDVNQMFAFVPSPSDSNIVYLYSVGQQKFVKKDASLVESSGDPIYIWTTGDTTHPLFFSFTNDKNNYNINIGGSNQMTIDTWKSYDAGNKVVATEVVNSGYDLSEAQAMLQRFSLSAASQGYQTTGMGNDTWLIRAVATGKATGDTKIKKVFVTLKDSTADLCDEVRLYTAPKESANDSSNFYLYADIKPIATAATAKSVELTPEEDFVIPAGLSRYIWLNVKVKDSTAFGATVDATLDSILTDTPNGADTVLVTNLDPAGEAKIFKVQSTVFPWWSYNTKIYRIPAMVQANDGTIVVAADDRRYHGADAGSGPDDIVYSYSEDGGKTWAKRIVMAKASGDRNSGIYSYGDPCLGKTKSGKLILLTCATSRGFWDGQTSPYIFTSTDNGRTWDSGRTINTPQTFTDKISGTQGVGIFSFFATSGRLINTSQNRLMCAVPVLYSKGSACDNYIIYSDDEGETWTLDNHPLWQGGGNETKLVELKNHNILASIRQGGGRGFNTATPDGLRWIGQSKNTTLPDPGCNEDIIAYGDSSMLIHTSLVAGRRANLHIYTSHDQGNTWTNRLTIQTGDAAYSTMEVLQNGDLAVFYEDASVDGHGYDMTYVSIPKEVVRSWEASGTPTYPDYHERVVSEYSKLFDADAPTTGYFTLSEQTKDNLQPLYDNYSTNCSLSEYFALQDTVRNADFNLPPTGYYRLKNAMRSSDQKYGWLHTVGTLNNTLTDTDASSVVKLTRNDDGTYCLSIQGQYIQTPSRSAQVSLSDTPANFTVSVSTPGQAAFIGNTSNNYSALHMGAAQGYIIVGWTQEAGASQWVVEDANEIAIPAQAIGGKSYATMFVPFATRLSSEYAFAAVVEDAGDHTAVIRAQEYSGAEQDVIPAGTPVLLYQNGDATEISLTIVPNNTAGSNTNGILTGAPRQIEDCTGVPEIERSEIWGWQERGVLTGSYLNTTITASDLTLSSRNTVAGFYSNSASALSANSACIKAADAGASGSLVIDLDTPTGIKSAISTSTFPHTGDHIYNLWGQRVDSHYKGIIIRNGKKELLK